MLPEQGSGREGLATAPMRTLVRRLPALGMLLLLLLMLTGLPAGHAACPPEEEGEGVGAEELIHFSDVVVLGKVVGRFRDEGSSLYRVELKVFCVYKGHDVPLLIDIAEAGDVSDPCPDHQMEVGGLYLAYLYKHHPHLYTPAFTPHPDTYRDEMFIVCDLNITTPTGAAEAMEEEGVQLTCEDDRPDYSDYEEEMCIRYTPQPGKTSHRAKEKPNQPGQTGKVERGGEGEGEGSGGVQTSLPLCLPLLLSAAFCTTLL